MFLGDFFVHGNVPFKLEVKFSAQSRGPVVNRTTLALLYWPEKGLGEFFRA